MVAQLRHFQLLLKPDGTLPCSQKPSTGPYSEPDDSTPFPPNLFLWDPLIYAQVLLVVLSFFQVFIPKLVWISLFSHTCFVSRSSYHLAFSHLNNMWWWVGTVKLSTMRSVHLYWIWNVWSELVAFRRARRLVCAHCSVPVQSGRCSIQFSSVHLFTFHRSV
jgi:hypothetical protein